MEIKYLLMAVLIAAITAGSNVLLKIGVAKPAWIMILDRANINGYFLISGLLFALSLLIYTVLLRDLPLYMAQSLIALQYIAVMAAAKWIMRENMSLTDFLGMSIIVLGILIVAYGNRGIRI